jgi:uncharacterized protein (DUF2235 family)
MPKNIVICCDGTNNQFDGDHTNVIRTYRAAVRSPLQVAFYDPGVGTMPEPGWLSSLGKRWSMVKGLAFGAGLLQNVEDAYRFLMATYAPGDKVFVFGFSRGAYTARAVAAMLHSVGLLHPGAENLIPYAIQYWRRDFGATSVGGKVCDEFKRTLSQPCPVHFVGVWDTVGSVGFINNFRTFPYTYRNASVRHVRHAVAIDERRACFQQNLMAPAFRNQDVKNVWFAGVHADVGGGYPASESGLAKIAFEWMMREARQAGLLLDDAALQSELNQTGAKPDATARQHDSMRGLWWLVELFLDRRYSPMEQVRRWRWEFNKPRSLPPSDQGLGVYLHTSVVDRIRSVTTYRPPNLPHDEARLRAQFQIET